MMPTLPQQFAKTASTYASKPCLVAKDKNGHWREISYRQTQRLVNNFVSGLFELGLAKGDRLAILSANRPSWVIVDLAAQSVGGISVPIHTSLSAAKIKYILNDSGAHILFVAGAENIEKILKIETKTRALKKIIYLNDAGSSNLDNWLGASPGSQVIAFEDVIELGRNRQKSANVSQSQPEDLASIVYTSGTTGEPKGVMLTHQNFLSNMQAALKAIPINSSDKFLSFLPLSHVLERTAGYYVPMAVGAAIYYAESVKKLSDNLREVQPTVLVSVPRIFERVYEKIMDKVSRESGLKKKLFFANLKIQSGIHHALREHRPISWFAKKKSQALDRLVGEKVRQNLGGNLRFTVSGGAALNKKIARFFENLGVNIIEGYGLTETSPIVTVNRLENYEFGTVGLPLENVQVKILLDKEILVKGPNVMSGYFNQSEETHNVLSQNGWFKTGDLGFVNSQGFLSVIGRKKEIIVTSGGKNISPEPIEAALQLSKYISQAMLIGNNRKFVTALIVPDFEKIKPRIEGDIRECRLQGHKEIVKHPQIQSLIQQEISHQLSDFADFEKPQKFIIIPHEFTQEAEELTPTLKLRRSVIMEKYKKEIDRMYE